MVVKIPLDLVVGVAIMMVKQSAALVEVVEVMVNLLTMAVVVKVEKVLGAVVELEVEMVLP
jgi:hypothetical protein